MSFIAKKATCGYCNTVFIVPQQHWRMTSCPACHDSSVDFESYHLRICGNISSLEDFEPPFFDDEDEYHSCLMSWLNDSDEEYIIWETSTTDVTLIVEKIK